MRFDPRVQKLEIAVASLFLVALVSFGTSLRAEPLKLTGSLPQTSGAPKLNMNWSDTQKPRIMSFTQLRSKLRPADEFAALYALQIALSRIGDGQTYVWGRPKRKLRAFITPVNSYRAKNGSICRKIIVSLALGSYLKRIKTSACRAKDNRWNLQSQS